jgi:hypothetical protein
MEEQFENQRFCLYNKVILKGRSDKKFCNLKCKNAYNNPIYREQQKVFIEDEKRLHKNRAVLKKFYEFSNGEEFIQIRPLYQQGFDPRFYTGTLDSKNAEGNVYIIYDYAFLFDQKQGIIIFYDKGGFHNI